MIMWGETGVALNKNTEAIVSETEMGLVSTFPQKQEEHLITYKSVNRRTTIYYILLVNRTDLKAAKYCKVIPGESAVAHW